MKSKYSENLKTLRNAAGLTLKQLSELSGIPLGTLFAYETKVEPRVGVYEHIVAICKKRAAENAKIAASL